MARTPDNKVTRETPLQVKMNPEERAAFDRAVERLGGTASSAVRDLPRIAWERDVLLDAGFPDGFSQDELNAIIDVMNGHKQLVGPESGDALLGEKLYADLADHGDEAYAELARRVVALPHSQRVALEVWAMMLWERSDDTDYWNAELAKRAVDGE
jgi:hypothetical protein